MVSMMFRWETPICIGKTSLSHLGGKRQNGLRFYVESLSKKLQVPVLLEQLRWIMDQFQGLKCGWLAMLLEPLNGAPAGFDWSLGYSLVEAQKIKSTNRFQMYFRNLGAFFRFWKV